MGSIDQQTDSGGNVRFSTAKQVVGAAVVLGGVALLVASIALPIFRHSTMSLALAGKMLGVMAVGGAVMGVGLHTGLQARVNRAAQQQMAPQATHINSKQLSQAALDQVDQPNAKKEHDERQACLNGRFNADSFNNEINTYKTHIERQDNAKPNTKCRYSVQSYDTSQTNTKDNETTTVYEVKTYDNNHNKDANFNMPITTSEQTLDGITISRTETHGLEAANNLAAGGELKMEDSCLVRSITIGGQTGQLGLVCDGHADNGSISKYITDHFHEHIQDAYNHFKEQNSWDDNHQIQPHEMANILSRASVLLHAAICDETMGPQTQDAFTTSHAAANGGSCMLASLKIGDSLYTVNVGDSRAVMAYKSGDSSTIQTLTYDASADDPLFQKDIKDRGGTLSVPRDTNRYGKDPIVGGNGKIAGDISCARSLGDERTHGKGSSCVPIINHVNLQDIKSSGANEVHLVLACDGVWDVCSSQEVGETILNNNSSPAIVTTAALEKNSGDNISVIHMKIPL